MQRSNLNIIRRKFLKLIFRLFPKVPFFYLGDYDAFGIDIMCDYV
jgi:hypothetical protein